MTNDLISRPLLIEPLKMHFNLKLVNEQPTVSLEEKQATSDKISNWIPVSERLPEYFERVLVSIKKYQVEFVRVDCFDGSDNWTCYGNDVIAWMPLPEPYKENNK